MKAPIQDLVHCWMSVVRRMDPSGAEQLDFAGFEQALIDVAEAGEVGDFSESQVERLGDAFLYLSESLLSDLQRQLGGDASFAIVGQSLAWLFRRERGLSSNDIDLRCLRRDAVAEMVTLLDSHLSQVVARREHAMRMRRSRREREHFTDPVNLDGVAPGLDVPDSAAAKEIAGRVVARTRSELDAPVFAFLRASIITPQFVASHSAREFRRSPAALSRARHRLRAILADECAECCPDDSTEISIALVDAFASAA